uniref:Patatin n=1 Tax=Tetraselmis sp. GSL018 TaxID=582737 RepID=A0A061S7R5_9CHLO
MSSTKVHITGASSNASRNSKLIIPLFQLLFRRSSCQHPILAGAIATLAEGPYCSVIAADLSAIQQIILMALSDNILVVKQACRTLALLASSDGATAAKLMESDVLQAMLTLMDVRSNTGIQLASLRVVSSLAFSSESAAGKIMSEELLDQLKGLMECQDRQVQALALEALGNLAYCYANRAQITQHRGLLRLLASLASRQSVTRPSQRSLDMPADNVADGALRALAILGENEEVRKCLGRPSLGSRRGVRILSMDGGGMRGIVTVRMLQELEEKTGRSVYELFDLIGGTSTGGILAVALGVKDLSLNDCNRIYTELGYKVFSRPNQKAGLPEDQLSWRESLYSMYKSSTQSMRVAMYGCKHDASAFEALLQEYCDMKQIGTPSNRFIVRLVGPRCLSCPHW